MKKRFAASKISWLGYLIFSLAVCMSFTSVASAQTKTFEEWAQGEGYSHNDTMPSSFNASSQDITSLDGIGLYNWTITPTKYLYLTDNRITSLGSNTFNELTNLQFLYLITKSIFSLPEICF